MAGPHSPNHTVGGNGPSGPEPPAESQPLEFPDDFRAGDAPANYARQPPPPGRTRDGGPSDG